VTPPANRAFWLKHLHQWHWVSSAVCLVGMLLFALTGVTLNHAGEIEGAPVTRRSSTTLPAAIVATLAGRPATNATTVPGDVARAIASGLSVDVAGRAAEWSDDEIYVALPRAGGDAFVTVDRASGLVEYERTDRGWVSYLNDLHKGRNTGVVWKAFLDVFSLGCVVFCLSGLVLLQMHAGQRPTTWPLVGLGLVVPLLIGLLLIH
jgi:hypothetical protein